MGLRVIGAGLSRTGTFSLKRALEQLGVGRCYHMHELFSHPEHAALWERAARGATVDWDGMFEGYAAACDAPACLFWRELSDFYPGAKVILTVRNPSEWYESMRSTVVEVMRRPTLLPDSSAQEVLRTAQRLVLDGFCGGRFDDVDETTRRFRAHSEEVPAAIPTDRLLIYEVSQGWDPLCTFLGLPIPSEPFPRTNERESFRARAKLRARPSGE
jgi:Sulfotransferase domain